MSATCKCYAVCAKSEALQPISIERRKCTANDVVIDIKYAGICHRFVINFFSINSFIEIWYSDIHTANEDWGPISYPFVPGHEIGKNL